MLDCYDIHEVIRRAKSPNVTLEAICKKPWKDPAPDGEKDTDKAKANGFRWNGDNKTWVRVCKDFEVGQMKEQLPFPIRVVEQ